MKKLIALAAIAASIYGCSTADSAQPAKSQTQDNRFDDCTFIIAAKVRLPIAGTNTVIEANGDELPTLELFTQTQSLESSGTESYAQTATQTPTTDIKPDIDVKYNDAIAAASTTSKGVLECLCDAGKDAVLNMMANKASGTVNVMKKDGTTATVECKDGQCSFVDSSTCSGGSCSPTPTASN